MLRTGLAIAGLIAIVGLVGAAYPTAANSDASKTARAGQQPAAAANYVGEEMCLTCHEKQGYKGTTHALKFNPRTPASMHGCESCHGAGKDHVEAGGDKTKILNPKTMDPREGSDTCTTCHDRGSHALWDGSQHDQRNVGCASCHTVHGAGGPKMLKAANETQLCASCHKNVTNKQQRFNHMPVREGKMACSSCHNVHGSSNVRLLKAGTTLDESCTSCHTEKRGPYLWEHAPVADACTTCHDPHGSNNDRMLVAKQPYICQRCHVTSRHPPTIYDGFVLKNSQNANKIFGRSCVSCHQLVHGSNSPNGKAFLR